MRVAIYARVSTESQEARGTIGSQLEVLRKRIETDGHQLIAEYCDDGCSGARLDRPGLDALREMVSIPVIGPGAAALHLAAQLGTRIAVLTPSGRGFGHVAARMRSLALAPLLPSQP